MIKLLDLEKISKEYEKKFRTTVGEKINELITEQVNNKSVYEVLVSQSGTNAPTVQATAENTIGAIVWTYSAAGTFIGTLSGAFTSGKTYCYTGGGDIGEIINLRRTGNNTVELTTIFNNSASGDNGILNNTPIKIVVYS